MSLVLYRKYRPKNFSEIIGQEKTVKILTSAVSSGRVAHAYLFTGPRGTGKTTIARILAKVINCTNRKGGEPCNECANCVALNTGRTFDVVEIDAGIDYRLRMLERVRAYHLPLDEAADASLSAAFSSLAGGKGESQVSLEIEGRQIATTRTSPGVVWFEFQTICGAPRGQADYIEIARRYHTVLISDIPKMTPEQSAEARRFTWLVDEFYDRRVKLIVSAQVPPQELYLGGSHSEEFDRTISRLAEMQTRQYLAQPHLP